MQSFCKGIHLFSCLKILNAAIKFVNIGLCEFYFNLYSGRRLFELSCLIGAPVLAPSKITVKVIFSETLILPVTKRKSA